MTKSDKTYYGYLCVAIAAVLWSTGGLFVKLVPWNGISINAGRCLVALVIRIIMRKFDLKLKLNRNTILAGVCFCINTTLYTLANKYTTSANAILLQYTSPLYIILISAFVKKRLPKRSDIFCSILIIFGIFLCCLDGDASSGGALGNFFAMLSGIAFSFTFYLNAKPDSAPANATFIGFALSAIVGMPFLMNESDFSPNVLLIIFVLGAVQICFAYSLFEIGIKKISALTANFITTLEPILNPVWVAIFYGETIGVFAILGGFLVIFSVVGYGVLNTRNAKNKSLNYI